MRRKKLLVGGIDEAGRGPLAGPVSLAMVVAPKGFRFQHPKLGKVRDCKKLSPRQREIWYQFLTSHPRLSWAHTYVSCHVIDRINIARAAHRGAARLVLKSKVTPDFVFLDGSLLLPNIIPHRVVTRGDERIPVVAAASIIAKVRRDRYMIRMAKKFPGYSFEQHKGYGTRIHMKAIRTLGLSDLHRASFTSHIEELA